MRRLIIIPTYNEAINAPILIRRIFKFIPNSDILVIDDGSPDGTAQIVENLHHFMFSNVSKNPALVVLIELDSLGALNVDIQS